MTLKLTVSGLHAGYGRVQILRNVSMQVTEGETVALLGTNGNGKSTLLKAIGGFVKPSAGSIIFEHAGQSVDIATLEPHDVVDLGISMIAEGRRLFSKLTVEENLRLGAYRPRARVELRRNLDLCYQTFPVLAERRTQQAGSMSGGQQQMVAIARSLMSSPRLLLIDEPSVGLSPLLVRQTVDKIGELRASHGLTVLMAEQNFNEAMRIATRGYVIVHGEIVYEGATVEDLRDNELVKSCYLGG